MSKETPTKRSRSTKKVTEGSNTAELEAKIAELEAKLANLSSQVKPAEAKPEPKPEQKPRPAASGPTHGTLPAGTKPAEAKPEPKPEQKPRPAASGPTHGTLPAGMKPAPKPEAAPEPTSAPPEPMSGEVAPAYSKISSTGYTGNKYYATRKRLSYHPADKQFTGNPTTTTTTTTAPPPPSPEPEPQESTSRGTLPAGMKPQEKKSLWKAKGSDAAENYVAEEQHKAPPPQQRPAASGPTHGTLPAGTKPAEAKPEPKPEQKPRPAASGPTHGTLPAGMKPAPKPEAAPEPTSAPPEPMSGEVAPAYSKISSTGYTGNKYYATRKRLSYHPADKQFTGNPTTTTQVAAEPPKPKSTFRTTLPAGFKP